MDLVRDALDMFSECSFSVEGPERFCAKDWLACQGLLAFGYEDYRRMLNDACVGYR